MDERAAVLNRRVAEAADAWLSDPADVGVYGRLVAAVRERRAYLHPTLDVILDGALPRPHALGRPGTSGPVLVIGSILDDEQTGHDQDDELLDELADQAPVQLLGAGLAGDPRTVLARLLRG